MFQLWHVCIWVQSYNSFIFEPSSIPQIVMSNCISFIMSKIITSYNCIFLGSLLQVLWLCVCDVRLSAGFQRILHRVWYQQGRPGMSKAAQWNNCRLWRSKAGKKAQNKFFFSFLSIISTVQDMFSWHVSSSENPILKFNFLCFFLCLFVTACHW